MNRRSNMATARKPMRITTRTTKKETRSMYISSVELTCLKYEKVFDLELNHDDLILHAQSFVFSMMTKFTTNHCYIVTLQSYQFTAFCRKCFKFYKKILKKCASLSNCPVKKFFETSFFDKLHFFFQSIFRFGV